MRNSYWYLLLGTYLVIVVVVHFVCEGNFAGISMGAGALIVALTGVIVAIQRANKTEAKVVVLEHKVNGGLAVEARKHFAEQEATTKAELTALFEQQRDDCLDKLEVVYERLDKHIGLGRCTNLPVDKERRGDNGTTSIQRT